VIVQELNDDVDSAASEVVTTSCEWQTSEAVLIIKGKLACGNVDIVSRVDWFDSYIQRKSETQTGAGQMKDVFLFSGLGVGEGATLYPYIYNIFFI